MGRYANDGFPFPPWPFLANMYKMWPGDAGSTNSFIKLSEFLHLWLHDIQSKQPATTIKQKYK